MQSTFLFPFPAIWSSGSIAREGRVCWWCMAQYRVTVRGVPRWIPPDRLLDAHDWSARVDAGEMIFEGERSFSEAADLQARLRGVVLAGVPISVEVKPGLSRSCVREARLVDARRRRMTTPGFDRPGCRADEEGRWSLTPATIALRIGRQASGRPVLDLGCGVGGNSIGFARAGSEVVAVERDAERLLSARHNAGVYEVEQKIKFVEGDAEGWGSEAEASIIFVDPPWGRDARSTSSGLADLPLLSRLHGARGPSRELWAKVPASFDTRTVAACEKEAVFGDAEGDRRFVKFLLLRWRGG